MPNYFLTNSHTMTPFDASGKQALGKGEIAHNKQFLLFAHCFLPDWITFFHFHQISYANPFSLEQSKICRLVMG